MTAEQVWRLLGITPTHDRAAIRNAYADALKAIDVDADPQAFMALRQAREEAIALAALLAPAQANGAVEQGDASGTPADDPRQSAAAAAGSVAARWRSSSEPFDRAIPRLRTNLIGTELNCGTKVAPDSALTLG